MWNVHSGVIQLFLLFAWLGTCNLCVSEIVSSVRVPCAADVSALTESPSVQRLQFWSHSQISCAAMSLQLPWVYLTCFFPQAQGGECSLWAKDALEVGNVTLQTDGNTSHCNILKGTLQPTGGAAAEAEGCLLTNGTVIGFGSTIANSRCPNLLEVCNSDGTLQLVDATQSPTCESPFTTVGSKCLMVMSRKVQWCIAREQCLEVGADLVSVATDAEYEELQQYFLKELPRTLHWVGVYEVDSDLWAWLRSNRDPTANSDWLPAQPDFGSDLACAFMGVQDGVPGLQDNHCDSRYVPICEVVISTPSTSSTSV